MNTLQYLLPLFLQCLVAGAADPKDVKCLVCKTVVEEVDHLIQKADPKKTVNVGSFRLDAEGNPKQNSIPYARSELHLTEVMDKVCNKMEDYVQATYKSSGKLTLLQLVNENGKMNPDFDKVDLIQDPDLNKSLKFYCQSIVEEYDENLIDLFSKNSENIDIKLCSDIAKVCDSVHEDYDYDFEDKEEL